MGMDLLDTINASGSNDQGESGDFVTGKRRGVSGDSGGVEPTRSGCRTSARYQATARIR